MKVIGYQPRHFDQVDALWQACFPDDPPRNRAAAAIPAKLALGDGLLLVAEDAAGRVLGTIMAGYDGHRGWLYAVASDPGHRGKGIGRALVEEACRRLAELGCVKVNLQVRAGNQSVAEFYRKLGFGEEARISMGRALS
ncbi:ribosomal protein S18 acetylase RimI-like enzyme [Novosphingobium chloroacetimidivorans]|uniref:Ribosomal protein S18 acetylase RimI-like enzyme n=1 Tax=Novosphingobium chloroacetimidivorans TaxID=1428314 RepID=A0A7W7NY07_9SPHN|nr:GNAT family acetyltransferase [Novosphingobium chloroacetimidivorans]MBB4859999.1 ribosomal protein S18 acetylase RimI-like enzyme [Novosphingobium chloroacetimidivorans]